VSCHNRHLDATPPPTAPAGRRSPESLAIDRGAPKTRRGALRPAPPSSVAAAWSPPSTPPTPTSASPTLPSRTRRGRASLWPDFRSW
jgi:hypothetical protein